MIRKRLAAAVLVALATFACSGPTSPSSNASETFSGSVQPNNVGPVHTFNIADVGEVNVAITAITPTGATLGIAYGQATGGGCAVIQRNAVSSANLGKVALTAQVTNKGTYCVQVFDPVALGLPPLIVGENYTLTVSHP